MRLDKTSRPSSEGPIQQAWDVGRASGLMEGSIFFSTHPKSFHKSRYVRSSERAFKKEMFLLEGMIKALAPSPAAISVLRLLGFDLSVQKAWKRGRIFGLMETTILLKMYEGHLSSTRCSKKAFKEEMQDLAIKVEFSARLPLRFSVLEFVNSEGLAHDDEDDVESKSQEHESTSGVLAEVPRIMLSRSVLEAAKL